LRGKEQKKSKNKNIPNPQRRNPNYYSITSRPFNNYVTLGVGGSSCST